jgi:hypothetical protein
VIGNQGVTRRLQAKLQVNQPGDHFEEEADRVAEQVMRMPNPAAASPASIGVTSRAPRPGVQRKCACSGSVTKCSHCQEEAMLQRSSKAATPDHAPPEVHDALSLPGHPLDAGTRNFMEARFGQDFSRVQVHADPQAARAADAVHASAFTVGNDVVFAQGNYAPGSDSGRRLLAHELTHVVQQQTGAPPAVQRDTNQPRNAPAASADLLKTLMPDLSPQLAKQFVVRAMRENEFQAMTGIKVNSLPEKKLLSPDDAGLASDPGMLAGLGAGVLTTPRPTLPLPAGTTGILWSADAHLSQFAIVPQENPVLAFFFGDSTLEAYGFRSNLPTHIGSSLDRAIPQKPFTPFTNKLNSGTATGDYVSDAVFPYIPSKGGSIAVYPQGGAENIPGAQELVACMQEANRSGSLKGMYTFSTPDRDKPAFDRAFGKGAAADSNFQPPEIVNCLNKANALTQKALQGRDLVINIDGRDVNLSTATDVATGDPVPGMLPSAAKNMRPYLDQWDANPATQGMYRTSMTGAHWLRGLTGVLRVGGFVLMIVNLDRIYNRYEVASDYDKPLVAGEEATMLTAGLLGSLIGEAIGEAVICVGAGPALGLCVLATAVVGGAIASGLMEDPARGIGQTLQDAAELNRQGKLLPGVLEAATMVMGSQQDKQLLQDFKKADSPREKGLLEFDFDWP